MPALLNSKTDFGLLSIALHWVMAIAVFGLFGLGLFMVDLDYYSPWYNRAPHLHESFGILFGLLLFARLGLRLLNAPPTPLISPGSIEARLARIFHYGLLLLMLAMLISGYLISSAGNRDIPVFTWFDLPALTDSFDNQEDLAGRWHRWLGWTLIVFSGLHTVAALKHHFVDRDATLMRMLGITTRDPSR